MRENFYAECAGTLTDGSKAWWAKYRFQQSSVIKTVNDRNGLVLFNCVESAREAGMRAHSMSYSMRPDRHSAERTE
jgi:hypothetical protein